MGTHNIYYPVLSRPSTTKSSQEYCHLLSRVGASVPKCCHTEPGISLNWHILPYNVECCQEQRLMSVDIFKQCLQLFKYRQLSLNIVKYCQVCQLSPTIVKHHHVPPSNSKRQQVLPSVTKYCQVQDKVNTADSAFIFLIIQSQNQWSGLSGQKRWSCLV